MNDVYSRCRANQDCGWVEVGPRLGTITLCGICHYAIQLRRFPVDPVVYGAPEADLWAHLGQKGCGMHDAEAPRFMIPVA